MEKIDVDEPVVTSPDSTKQEEMPTPESTVGSTENPCKLPYKIRVSVSLEYWFYTAGHEPKLNMRPFPPKATPTSSYEVLDCPGYEVEIGPDSTNDYSSRFQVSPMHSPGKRSRTSYRFRDFRLILGRVMTRCIIFIALFFSLQSAGYDEHLAIVEVSLALVYSELSSVHCAFSLSGIPLFFYVPKCLLTVDRHVCNWQARLKFCVLLLQITRQLELDSSQWLQSNSSGKGFLCNEVGVTESYHSPESQWSDNSGK